MGSKDILKLALVLKPEERFLIVESLINSLDNPDPELDAIWAKEAESRLSAYRQGRLKRVPMKDVFREK